MARMKGAGGRAVVPMVGGSRCVPTCGLMEIHGHIHHHGVSLGCHVDHAAADDVGPLVDPREREREERSGGGCCARGLAQVTVKREAQREAKGTPQLTFMLSLSPKLRTRCKPRPTHNGGCIDDGTAYSARRLRGVLRQGRRGQDRRGTARQTAQRPSGGGVCGVTVWRRRRALWNEADEESIGDPRTCAWATARLSSEAS